MPDPIILGRHRVLMSSCLQIDTVTLFQNDLMQFCNSVCKYPNWRTLVLCCRWGRRQTLIRGCGWRWSSVKHYLSQWAAMLWTIRWITSYNHLEETFYHIPRSLPLLTRVRCPQLHWTAPCAYHPTSRRCHNSDANPQSAMYVLAYI